jgi:hypothetical protein
LVNENDQVALATAVKRRAASADHIAISGSTGRSFFVSGISVIVASVSNSTLATETAFSNAVRTTLAGRANWPDDPSGCRADCFNA